MISYCAGKCDTASIAGTVRLELRFSASKQVFAIFSPEGARFMARQLEQLANDAEAWTAPDAEPTDDTKGV